jgi:UDP-glucose 4-epimerase
MSIIASGKNGTIGKHLPVGILALNQRLDNLNHREINLARKDTYIHLAGIVGPRNVEEDRTLAHKINVEAVAQIAQIALEKDIQKFVYISTSHVYAKGDIDKTETSPIEPINEYAAQKYEAEEELVKIFSDKPEKLLILRVFSILDWDVKSFTLGGAIQRLKTDRESKLSYGGDMRDFLTPKQTADVILELSRKELNSQIINVCTGDATSIADAAILLLNSQGTGDWAQRISREISETPRLVGNTDLLSRTLGRQLQWAYKKPL